jgi:adenylate cyclase
MTSQAKAGQIITTSTMVERLSSEWRASVRQIDVATLKGRSSEFALFEVLWQPEESTSMVATINAGDSDKPQRLRLRYQGQEVLVDHTHEIITIGRAEDNDLVIKGNLISRLHARIEMNRNKFMLIDQSTNGTFVAVKDGEDAFVRRDSMQIRGEGMIGLGKVPDENSSQVIRYFFED